MAMLSRLSVVRQHVFQAAFFAGAKPRCSGRPVLQKEECDNTKQDCGSAFNGQHPLPTMDTVDPVHPTHNPARDQTTQYTCHSDTGIENRQCAGATACREPVRQIQNNARKEAGLEYTEKEPQDVKLCAIRY